MTSQNQSKHDDLNEKLRFAEAVWREIVDESDYILECSPKLTLSNFQALRRHSVKLCKLINEYRGLQDDISALAEG